MDETEFSYEDDIAPLRRNLTRDVLDSDAVRSMRATYGAQSRGAITGGIILDDILTGRNVRRAAAANELERSRYQNIGLRRDLGMEEPIEDAVTARQQLFAVLNTPGIPSAARAQYVTSLIGTTNPDVFRRDKILFEQMQDAARNLYQDASLEARSKELQERSKPKSLTTSDILAVNKSLGNLPSDDELNPTKRRSAFQLVKKEIPGTQGWMVIPDDAQHAIRSAILMLDPDAADSYEPELKKAFDSNDVAAAQSVYNKALKKAQAKRTTEPGYGGESSKNSDDGGVDPLDT